MGNDSIYKLQHNKQTMIVYCNDRGGQGFPSAPTWSGWEDASLVTSTTARHHGRSHYSTWGILCPKRLDGESWNGYLVYTFDKSGYIWWWSVKGLNLTLTNKL